MIAPPSRPCAPGRPDQFSPVCVAVLGDHALWECSSAIALRCVLWWVRLLSYILRGSGKSHTMGDVEDQLLREMLRNSGLSRSQKQDMLNKIRANIDGLQTPFPANPREYVKRVRALLWTSLFPQNGPSWAESTPDNTECIGRAAAWQILRAEFHSFSGAGKPLVEIRGVMIDAIDMVMRNDFPLELPPRWVAELMHWINRLTALHNESLRLKL